MIQSLLLSIGDLADRRIIAILLRSMLITLAIFILIGIGIGLALDGSDPCGWIGDASCTIGPAAGTIGSIALTLLGMWLLFPAIALGVVCAYIDRISTIVETRHYPQAAASARSNSAAAMAWLGLRSAGRVLIYNLIALPFYILLLITGIGPLILFVAVNGVAMGRDVGEMVAMRHRDRAARRIWLLDTRGGRFIIGAAVTALFLVPFANLLAPVIGAAAATHYFHRTNIGKQ